MDHPKIHSRLLEILSTRAASASSLAAATTEIPISVKYQWRDSTNVAVATTDGLSIGRHQFTRLLSGRALRATPGSIQALAAQPNVEMIWYDEPVHTCLDATIPLIGVPPVYAAGYTGKGIRVGIVDTGIDPSHPDFAGRIVQLKDFTGTDTSDHNGHGTHVAGIIGGNGVASNGRYRGVAPDCQFIIAKALGSDGNGQTSDVIAGLEFLVEQNVQIVNLSLGGGGSSDGTDALSAACDAAADHGLVVCVAAGNAGPSSGTIGSPGCARNVITIGATDKQDQFADFSSCGPTTDGRVKPDVCFPGAAIHSTRAAGTALGVVIDQYYTALSGTSMATPHAAGTCALLLQAKPRMTPQQTKDALLDTAKSIRLPPNRQGHGRAQVYAAFQRVTSPPIISVAFSPSTSNLGEVLNVSITVRNDSADTLTTQGPDPGFIYDEGDSFISI